MRLFVALNLPEAERDRLQRAAGVLRSAGLPVRWVAADALHLTLKFLGEVPDARRGEIEAALVEAAAGVPAFDFELRGLGGFPNLRSPRVVWVGVQAPPELARLAAAEEERLAALGFPREERPFSPHLTLGRAERGAGPGRFTRLAELVADFHYAASVEARTVDLMRSRLSPGGARYERLAQAPLGGRSDLEGGEAE